MTANKFYKKQKHSEPECFSFYVRDIVCKDYTSLRLSFISDFTLFGSRDFFSAA